MRLVGGGRKRKEETRTFARFRLYPDSSAIALYDSLTDCKSDARARVVLPVEPLKDSENLGGIFRLDSYSIVLDDK